ncbi:MAG: hypothetical protein Q7J35_13855 [Candidatus Methanoperedens sp.]|nr:hypothetical protein [Candidatus Methanoperedens sp.]
MVRKSKAIAVSEHKEIDEQQLDELREKYFIKLMQETKNKKNKICMKYVAEQFNPDDSLAKSIRRLLMTMFIWICNLEKERDEARLKLREYEEGTT